MLKKLILIVSVLLLSVSQVEASYTYSIIKSSNFYNCATGGASGSCTITIPSVTTANTVVLYLGSTTSDTGTLTANPPFGFAVLTDSTTVTCTEATVNTSCFVQVVEYNSGTALTANGIQRGVAAIDSAASAQVTLSNAVNTAKASVIWCGDRYSGAVPIQSRAQTKLVLTDSTHVTASVNTADSGGASHSVCVQVIDNK